MGYLTGLARFAVAAQGTQMSAGPSQSARPDPVATRRKRGARGVIVALLFPLSLDRRFCHAVAMLGFASGAARASGRDSRARMVAWDIRQRERAMKAAAPHAAHRARGA